MAVAAIFKSHVYIPTSSESQERDPFKRQVIILLAHCLSN